MLKYQNVNITYLENLARRCIQEAAGVERSVTDTDPATEIPNKTCIQEDVHEERSVTHMDLPPEIPNETCIQEDIPEERSVIDMDLPTETPDETSAVEPVNTPMRQTHEDTDTHVSTTI